MGLLAGLERILPSQETVEAENESLERLEKGSTLSGSSRG